MTHMRMPLYNEPPHFRENEIVEPRMPNGDSVVQYFQNIHESLLDFIRRSIVLLPNVDANGINPEHLGKR